VGPDRLELRFLLVARDGDAAALPGGDALLKGRVVERAAMPEYFVQHPLLRGRWPQFLFVGLAYALRHDYFSPLCRSAYSRSAQMTSPLKDRSCRLARARIAANTSSGKRIEMRCSPFCVFSMYPFYHTEGYMATGRDCWLEPGSASPPGLKP